MCSLCVWIYAQFVGRFPVLAKLQSLSREQMVHVMTTPRNALMKQYQALFAADGISLQMTQSAVLAIADQADRSKTGARGLRSIIENALNEAMYQLPTWRKQGITHVVVTERTIIDKQLVRHPADSRLGCATHVRVQSHVIYMHMLSMSMPMSHVNVT